MKPMITMFSMLFATLSFAEEQAVPVSKATELAVHRIERLVTLKKIDEVFRNQLVSLRVEKTAENNATYKVVAKVAPAASGKASAITLWQDSQGKTLSHSVEMEGAPANPQNWPDKDAASLMEEALHFVLEGWVNHPEVKVFYTDMKTISLSAVQDGRGQLVAQFRVAENSPKTLVIRLDSAGRFLSHELN